MKTLKISCTRKPTSDYVYKECKIYKRGYIKLKHEGSYVADFFVSYKTKDQELVAFFPYNKSFLGKTLGFKSPIINLPGDAYDIHVRAYAYTGLKWQPTKEIFDVTYDSVTRVRWKARGTASKPFPVEKKEYTKHSSFDSMDMRF